MWIDIYHTIEKTDSYLPCLIVKYAYAFARLYLNLQRSLNLVYHNLCSSAFKIKMNIVQIFLAAYAKSLLDSDLTMKRKLLEMKQFPGKHTVWILLLCAFQTGPKPVPACCTQTPGAVTRSGFLPSCQACTTVWMNNARSCLEPMPLSAMTWRYNIQLF